MIRDPDSVPAATSPYAGSFDSLTILCSDYLPSGTIMVSRDLYNEMKDPGSTVARLNAFAERFTAEFGSGEVDP